MPIDYNTFIHPKDRAALNALQAIPFMDTILRKVMAAIDERYMYQMYNISKIRLSRNQLPKVYGMLEEISDRLGIEVPTIYLESGPANAYTIGDMHPIIVLYSECLSVLHERELYSIIAHECGHILCHHVLYSTLARFIFQNGVAHLGIPQTVTLSLMYGLLYWSRCSEFSADRVATYCVQDPDCFGKAMFNMTGGFRFLDYGELNYDEFISQANQHYENIGNSLIEKIMYLWMVKDQDHPFQALRVKEIREWYNREKNNLPPFSGNNSRSSVIQYTVK